jgi:CheY-like chemotaxis protein
VDSHLELRVTDTGAGISSEFLPYVFERFRQEEAAANRKQGGLGLGLAIVRSIMEAHGGGVRVQSAGENRGATFVVVLPLGASREDDEEIPGHSLDARSSPLCDVDLSGVRVLVVDDESDARVLVRRILQDAGAKVTAAESADETMLELKREVPDVLISDIGMPGKTGFDLIRAVRGLSDQQGGKVPAIALTAFARAEDRTRVMLSGYQVHVAKPVDAAELCAVVASLSGRARPY